MLLHCRVVFSVAVVTSMIIVDFRITLILLLTTAARILSTAVTVIQFSVLAAAIFSSRNWTCVIFLSLRAVTLLLSERIGVSNPYFAFFFLQCYFALCHSSVAILLFIMCRGGRRIRETAQVRH